MSNFVFSSDPLLYSGPTLPSQQTNEFDIKRQLDNLMIQYQNLQQAPPHKPEYIHDHIGELDDIIAKLDEDMMKELNNNNEFVVLNNYIQQSIQSEVMKSVKVKLNSNPEFVSRVNKMKEIIAGAQQQKDQESKRNLDELTDYIQNYSDMTFNEYKQLKYAKK